MKIIPLLALPLFLLGSCSDGDSSSDSASTPAFLPFSQRLAQDSMRDPNALAADAEGVWRPQSNKRSPMESQRQSPFFKGEVERPVYQAGDYAKKSFWGNKEYKPPAYAGNTDGSRFAQTSRLQGQSAGEAGQGYGTDAYATNGYATSGANEAGGTRLGRPGSAYAESRQGNFEQPAMVDWQQQRGLSLGETKGLRGR